MTRTAATATPTATPTKLRDGSWGARCSAGVEAGDTITITTRGGKTWQAEVVRVLWSGADKYGKGQISICATASLDDRPSRGRVTRRGRAYYQGGTEIACGYPCPVTGRTCTPDHPCHDCL